MKQVVLRKNGTKRVVTINNEPSKTDQQFKQDCDVNFIVQKFLKTGQISHLAKHQGTFSDVSEIPDLHTALTQVTQAQEAFNNLPAELRVRFGNSPVEMVNFLQNPQNDEEAIKLGLKVRPDNDSMEYAPASKQPQGASKKTGSKKSSPTPTNDDNSNDDE